MRLPATVTRRVTPIPDEYWTQPRPARRLAFVWTRLVRPQHSTQCVLLKRAVRPEVRP